jgi:hypothetical protein
MTAVLTTIPTIATAQPSTVIAEKKKRKKVRRLSTSGNITEKECTTKVTEPTKYYDQGRGSVPGLYAVISPTSFPAIFHVKCTTQEGKERPIKIGRFHATELNVAQAREIAKVERARMGHAQQTTLSWAHSTDRPLVSVM